MAVVRPPSPSIQQTDGQAWAAGQGGHLRPGLAYDRGMPLPDCPALRRHMIPTAETKVLPPLRRKHGLHGMSPEALEEVSKSLLKPSPPCSLIKSSGRRNRDRDLAELMHIEFIGVAVEYERRAHHDPFGTVSADNAR